MDLLIRAAAKDDWDSIWPIFRAVVGGGDTFSFSPDIEEEKARQIWTESATAYVSVLSGEVVGSFFLRPNQSGLGDHVANAGYMVDPRFRGRGIAREMGLFSIQEAARLGYSAMQFNFVVSTNTVAVKLWQELGFRIVGTVPKAFRHRQLGLTDVYVMYREI